MPKNRSTRSSAKPSKPTAGKAASPTKQAGVFDGPKRAYVYEAGRDDNDNPIYKVTPPVVVLAPGDDFEFVNTVDNADAEWTVVDDTFFKKPVKKEKVKKQKSSGPKVPNRQIGESKATRYEVTVNGIRATANSDPVIIIDP